jgi:hypothetical protein
MVDVRCGDCGVEVIVIPSALRDEINEELLDEVEAHVAGMTTSDGKRLVIADETGQFACPVCGALGDAPALAHA